MLTTYFPSTRYRWQMWQCYSESRVRFIFVLFGSVLFCSVLLSRDESSLFSCIVALACLQYLTYSLICRAPSGNNNDDRSLIIFSFLHRTNIAYLPTYLHTYIHPRPYRRARCNDLRRLPCHSTYGFGRKLGAALGLASGGSERYLA
ncbi:hypothetical protein F5Y09DRAFT_326146 [Xylaria sp. FL1042]|nr:hypothetical protein F5Y09DRAFT_326146 [Xylaria sp. FL1042]